MRSTPSLCITRGCTARGRHNPASQCDEDLCRGCLPRRAADGLALCQRHVDLLAEDALTAGKLYHALADRLASPSVPGERMSGSRNPGLKINLAALGVRIVIRHTLVAWSKLIIDDRGVSLSAIDSSGAGAVYVLSAFVARHADWLAARPGSLPADASEELRDLVRDAHPIAYPSGTRIFDVAACPTEGCPGTLRAVLRRSDALLPAAIVCGVDAAHTWTADRWMTLGRQIREYR